MSDPEDEWITIAEAAHWLDVHERHARRLIQRLPATERSAPGVRPAKVHWTPENVRQMTSPFDISESEPGVHSRKKSGNRATQSAEPLPDTSRMDILPDMSNTMSEPSRMDSPDRVALLEQLRSENAYLRAELTATREAAEVAASESRRLLLAAMPAPTVPQAITQEGYPEAPEPEPEPLPVPEQLRMGWIARTLDRIGWRSR